MNITLFIITLVLVIIFSLYYVNVKEHFEQRVLVNYDCKSVIKEKLGLSEEEYQRRFRINVGDKLIAKMPKCAISSKVAPTDVLNSLKPNLKQLENNNIMNDNNTCVLPLASAISDFGSESVQLVRGNDPVNYMCRISLGKESVSVPSNINQHYSGSTSRILSLKGTSPSDNYMTWGCVLDPIDSDFTENIAKLYYNRNMPFFDDLQEEVTVCDGLEQNISQLQTQRSSIQQQFAKQQLITNQYQNDYKQAQQDYAKQQAETDHAKSQYDTAQEGVRYAFAKYQSYFDTINARRGLRYAKYNGYFADNLSFFRTNQPTVTGTTTDVNTIIPSSGDERISTMVTGFVYPDVSGNWIFSLTTDDAGYMWIGDNAINNWTTENATIRNGGVHGMTERRATIELEADTPYPIRIVQGNNEGSNGLNIYYIRPNGERSFSTTEVFWTPGTAFS